jgi:hypothetical protein
MPPRTSDELITARRIAEAIIAVVNDTPTGAHADLLFAPLQQWITREQFAQTMRVLVEAPRIAQRGDRYFPISRNTARPIDGRPASAPQRRRLSRRDRMSKPTKLCVTPAERAALIAGKRIALAVQAVIADCKHGAAGALLFAPLQPWLTQTEFYTLMSGLVRRGHLRREGDTFFPPEQALESELAEAAE